MRSDPGSEVITSDSSLVVVFQSEVDFLPPTKHIFVAEGIGEYICVCVYMYLYIYIYTHVLYIRIYIDKYTYTVHSYSYLQKG